MSRRCARPGCHRFAEFTLSYAYAEKTVWLVSLDAESHPMNHDMCAEHAERLSVPYGWELRREIHQPVEESVRVLRSLAS